jgi:hypothetical protein
MAGRYNVAKIPVFSVDCRAVRLPRHIIFSDTYERVCVQHACHLSGQSIEPESHADAEHAAVLRGGRLVAGRGEASAFAAGASSSARANTPIGTKSAVLSSRTSTPDEDSADGVGAPVAHDALRQLNTRLAFRP